MIERIVIVALLTVAFVAAYYAIRALHLRRINLDPKHTSTLPTLLYFRADTCAVCPTQGRIIEQLVAQWDGRVCVETVDAEREPEVAARYWVFSLPTTIWLDGDGQVQNINYGLADARKLNRQLTAVSYPAVDPVPARLSKPVETMPTT
ncbi:MAG: thioredoxin family protein [Chloroflexota bacterium]